MKIQKFCTIITITLASCFPAFGLPNLQALANGRQAYCSGASNKGFHVTWNATTIQEACQEVDSRLKSQGTIKQRWALGFYEESHLLSIQILCANGAVRQVNGIGSQAFQEALSERPDDTCIFKVVRESIR